MVASHLDFPARSGIRAQSQLAGYGASRVIATRDISVREPLPPAGTVCRLRLAGPAGQHLELEMASGAAKKMVLELCREGWAVP
jgi:hypothetical protein